MFRKRGKIPASGCEEFAVELLRVQEENAVMFRKLHEQQLELVDALSNNTNGRH